MAKSLICAVLILYSFVASVRVGAQDARLRVFLDPTSFAGPTYQGMQKLADQVAGVVEQLIPEASPEATDILCFAPPPEWGYAPVTLAGEPRPGEPAASDRYAVRVAVSQSVLPADWQRFAFQLAHELAHVRMDPRFDNDILETFAVAVSFEVLDRIGYGSYLQAAIQSLIAPLPAEIRAALANGSWNEVNLYLRRQRMFHEEHPFDYSLAAAGAMLVRATHVLPWNRLLGIGQKNQCPARVDPPRFQFCPLNESALPEFLPVFRLLGRATAPAEIASQGTNPATR
jgi:hypothetical protein